MKAILKHSKDTDFIINGEETGDIDIMHGDSYKKAKLNFPKFPALDQSKAANSHDFDENSTN